MPVFEYSLVKAGPAPQMLPYGTPLGVLEGGRLRFIAFRPGWHTRFEEGMATSEDQRHAPISASAAALGLLLSRALRFLSDEYWG